MDNPNEQHILNAEGEERTVAAFINGLHGVPGQQVKYRLPNALQEAIQIPLTVTAAESHKHRYERVSTSNNNVFLTLSLIHI